MKIKRTTYSYITEHGSCKQAAIRTLNRCVDDANKLSRVQLSVSIELGRKVTPPGVGNVCPLAGRGASRKKLGGPVTFNDAFDRLMLAEGGYVHNFSDPGGETRWGISKRSYPRIDIKNLSREDAKDIYYTDFWLRIHADSLPDGVAFQTFDFAVNSGISTAIRYLQRALGVADDGHWGPASQVAAAAMSESDTILRLNAERLEFMTKLVNWPDASRGWVRRIAANLRYGAEDA